MDKNPIEEKKDRNDLVLALIIILTVGIPIFSLVHFIDIDNERLLHDNWIKGNSPCIFLKNFVSDTTKQSYPLFYDGAVRKINSAECLD